MNLQELLERRLACLADAQEAETLKTLAREPDARAVIRDELALHALLGAVLRAPTAQQMARRVAGTLERHRTAQRVLDTVRRRRVSRRRLRWSAWLTAAMVMLAFGLWSVFPGQGDPPPGPVQAEQLTWKDGSQVAFDAGSRAAVLSSGATIRLDSGGLEARVTKRDPGRPFVIETPHGLVVVVGTHFTLGVTAQHSELRVLEGIVRLGTAGEPGMLVRAGEQAVLPGEKTGSDATKSNPATADLRSARLIDDHEQGLAWSEENHDPRLSFMRSEEQAAGGRYALRLDSRLEPHASQSDFCYVIHPLRLRPGDSAIRLALRSTTPANGAWFLHLIDSAQNHWMLNPGRPLSGLSPGWNTIILELQPPESPPSRAAVQGQIIGDGVYDVQRMTTLSIGVSPGSSTLFVDEIQVLGNAEHAQDR